MPTAVLDLTPAPGAAPALRRVFRHALTEARLLARNGEQLLLALVIPVGVVVLGPLLGGRLGGLDVLAPSVLALAVWSSAFTSVAIATGFERRYGVLERLAATPLGRTGLIAGKAGAVLLVLAGQLVVLVTIGLLAGWRPTFTPLSALVAVTLVMLAAAAFVSLALLLAGRLRAEVTLAVANLVYVVLVVGGALVVPLDRYPAAVQPVLALLPTAALGEGLRAAATGRLPLTALAILLVWLLAAAALARRLFRWT
jgi:ABC-2 type transport system permease protein